MSALWILLDTFWGQMLGDILLLPLLSLSRQTLTIIYPPMSLYFVTTSPSFGSSREEEGILNISKYWVGQNFV